MLTDDPQIRQRIRLQTQRGNDVCPLSEMQAAVLMPQLEKLDDQNQKRTEAVALLRQQLEGCEFLEVVSAEQSATSAPAFYKVAIRCRHIADRTQLETLSSLLRRHGVPIDPAFTGLHLTHSSRRFRAAGSLDNATALHHQLLTLHHPVLLADDQIIRRMSGLLHRHTRDDVRGDI